jgi:hypothetical protein
MEERVGKANIVTADYIYIFIYMGKLMLMNTVYVLHRANHE